MSFEMVQPGQWAARAALGEEDATVTKNGQLTVHKAALQAVGIGDRCVVLCDCDTLRLALRPVDSGEDEFAVRVSTPHAKRGRATSNRRLVNVNRAVRKLGLEAAALCGSVHKLTTKGSLLIVNLAGEQLTGDAVANAKGQKGKK